MKKTNKIKTEEEEIFFLKENETSKQFKYAQLVYSSEKGFLKLFEYLYSSMAHTKCFKENIKKVFLISLKYKHCNIIKFLFEQNIKISKKICNEFIMYAHSNEDELSKLLIESNYTFDNKNFEWRECLKFAAEKNNAILLEKIINIYGNWLSIIDIFELISNNGINDNNFSFVLNIFRKNIIRDTSYEVDYLDITYLYSGYGNLFKRTHNSRESLLVSVIKNSNKFSMMLDNFTFDRDFLIFLNEKLEREESLYLNTKAVEWGYSTNNYFRLKESHKILKEYLTIENIQIEIKLQVFKKLEEKARKNTMNITQYLEFLINRYD